jgi:hypothetical protein
MADQDQRNTHSCSQIQQKAMLVMILIVAHDGLVPPLARLSQLAAKNRSNSRFSGVWCRKVGTTEWTVIMLPEYRLL